MIDLDKAQSEIAESTGWDSVFRVDGREVAMLPPDKVRADDARAGVLPWLVGKILRAWRVVFGGSEIASLRRQVLSGVDENDRESRAVVNRLGLYHLGLLAAAWREQATALQRRIAMKAALGEGTPRQARRHQGTQGDEGRIDAAVKRGSTGVESAMGLTGQRVELGAGGGRMPGIMGGQLWGKAWVDANPEEALKRLEARMDRDANAAAELRRKASRQQAGGGIEASRQDEANQTLEVSHGG